MKGATGSLQAISLALALGALVPGSLRANYFHPSPEELHAAIDLLFKMEVHSRADREAVDVARATVNHGGQAGVAAITKHLVEGDFGHLSGEVYEALSHLMWPEAVPGLIAAVQRGPKETRPEALKAMSHRDGTVGLMLRPVLQAIAIDQADSDHRLALEGLDMSWRTDPAYRTQLFRLLLARPKPLEDLDILCLIMSEGRTVAGWEDLAQVLRQAQVPGAKEAAIAYVDAQVQAKDVSGFIEYLSDLDEDPFAKRLEGMAARAGILKWNRDALFAAALREQHRNDKALWESSILGVLDKGEDKDFEVRQKAALSSAAAEPWAGCVPAAARCLTWSDAEIADLAVTVLKSSKGMGATAQLRTLWEKHRGDEGEVPLRILRSLPEPLGQTGLSMARSAVKASNPPVSALGRARILETRVGDIVDARGNTVAADENFLGKLAAIEACDGSSFGASGGVRYVMHRCGDEDGMSPGCLIDILDTRGTTLGAWGAPELMVKDALKVSAAGDRCVLEIERDAGEADGAIAMIDAKGKLVGWADGAPQNGGKWIRVGDDEVYLAPVYWPIVEKEGDSGDLARPYQAKTTLYDKAMVPRWSVVGSDAFLSPSGAFVAYAEGVSGVVMTIEGKRSFEFGLNLKGRVWEAPMQRARPLPVVVGVNDQGVAELLGVAGGKWVNFEVHPDGSKRVLSEREKGAGPARRKK